jgi:hypothetical protein
MKARLPPELGMIYEHLSGCLEDWEKCFPKPLHSDFVSEWKEDMAAYIANVNPDSELHECIVTGLLEAYGEWSQQSEQLTIEHTLVDTQETFLLMQRPQTTQRTENWYLEFQKCLTASEIFKVFGSSRERAILAMQKAGKLELGARGSNSAAIKSAMSPFDWGICYEPVVKLVLESSWGAMIHECGRFVHLTDTRLAASPDGLILKANKPEMAGHLLEIKCPKSREIGKKIPSEYYYQMQLQLEVTGVRACEYVEAKFEFTEDPAALAESAYKGLIAIIGLFNDASQEWLPSKYMYGPLGDLSWKPDLGLNEKVLELNSWKLVKLHHETVLRDKVWFAGLGPKLEEFWRDVEKAKVGEFSVPESSRKKKVVCGIVDSEPEASASA